MARKLKVGVIGANWTGIMHVPAWRSLPDIEVAAICTSREETARAAAEQFQVERPYWSVADLVRDPDLDIIDVGTRPSLRYDMVMAALAAGKHVYNCLPFATSAEAAIAMRDTALAAGLVGAVDAQWRWTPAIRRMKEIIDEGGIGDFYTATIHMQLPLYNENGNVFTMCMQSTTTHPYLWLADASSGASAWRNFGSHTILNLMYLFGEVEEIVAVTETFAKDLRFPDGKRIRPQTADFGLALVRLRNGGLANINVSWAMADAPGYFLEVCGSKGHMVARDIGFCDTPTTLYHGDAKYSPFQPTGTLVEIPDRLYAVEGTPWSKDNAPPFMLPLTGLFSDMARVIRTGAGDASPSFTEAAHAHCAVEAAELSMKTKSWVRVSDLE